ncbi:HAMP domain-containing histidine kinase [Ruminococcus sp. OA3]|uniref:sensor histidine kinase n=1 Tax=Ruminococcus sp. OA3 TaxID=2914164 RepID=UPI001F06771B|nr:HAMP domain-containing sensor histidine kinase [Ruminococcus sp. OA3]MCH1981403.1 HAMP domain-containing histidine kinase [Ruminococcus sp. OA3]
MRLNSEVMIWLFCAAAVVTAAAFVWAAVSHRRIQKLYDRLDSMLNKAISGTFQEACFDETRQSELENKLYRYVKLTRMSARQQKEDQERVRTLISDISHQTKTPIANSLLYSELLLEQPLPEEGRDCADALHVQVKKLDFLIQALIKSSRLESGVIAVYPREEEVSPMVRQAVAQAALKAELKGVVIHCEQMAGRAFFDRKWTAEALYNLLDNAVKYSPPNCSIRISATEYPMFYRIDIADEGKGIPEEEQTLIFARFYRSQDAAQEEGIGIGLYLTREILKKQGGYVKVRSEYGKGSVFSVFLLREKPGK